MLLRHPALLLDLPNLHSFTLSSFKTQSSVFLFNQPVPIPIGWTFPVFPDGSLSLPSSHQIQQQWMLYMIRLDRIMEDALRLNVKWSLLELSKAINGDGKTTPNPLFRVLVTLQNDMQGGVAQVGITLLLTPENYSYFIRQSPSTLKPDLWP